MDEPDPELVTEEVASVHDDDSPNIQIQDGRDNTHGDGHMLQPTLTLAVDEFRTELAGLMARLEQARQRETGTATTNAETT